MQFQETMTLVFRKTHTRKTNFSESYFLFSGNQVTGDLNFFSAIYTLLNIQTTPNANARNGAHRPNCSLNTMCETTFTFIKLGAHS